MNNTTEYSLEEENRTPVHCCKYEVCASICTSTWIWLIFFSVFVFMAHLYLPWLPGVILVLLYFSLDGANITPMYCCLIAALIPSGQWGSSSCQLVTQLPDQQLWLFCQQQESANEGNCSSHPWSHKLAKRWMGHSGKNLLSVLAGLWFSTYLEPRYLESQASLQLIFRDYFHSIRNR